MPLTNAGRDHIATTLIGGTVTPFDSSSAHLGVGDSTVAFAVTQNDLQASTNRVRKPMDATYPTRSANVLTLRATFGTGDANWVWNEWCVANALTGGTMLSRKVENLGTKISSQTWTLTATLTVTAA